MRAWRKDQNPIAAILLVLAIIFFGIGMASQANAGTYSQWSALGGALGITSAGINALSRRRRNRRNHSGS